jgi:endoglucanase
VLSLLLAAVLLLSIPLPAVGAVAPLPGPSYPMLYDDFSGGGTFKQNWANWYNQSGGTGTFAKTTVEERAVGRFTQTPASAYSWAKFEPQHDNGNFNGYQYVTVVMKNPGYPDARIRMGISDGTHDYTLTGDWISVPGEWTSFHFDLDQFPVLNKKSIHFSIWLKQNGGQYGEILIDSISGSSQAAGSAPVLSAAGVSSSSGDANTRFTFGAVYTDADNDPPFAVQMVLNDSTVYDMDEVDRGDFNYADGKAYTLSARLPAGNHTYYLRAADGYNDQTATAGQPLAVAAVAQIVDMNDSTAVMGHNRLEYTGSGWQYTAAPAGSYGSDQHESGTADGTAVFTFVGTKVQLYGAKDPSYGIAAISLDGGEELNADSYGAARQENTLLYTSPELPNGLHTLKVRVTGLSNPASTGARISIDRINAAVYTGSLVDSINVSQAGYGAADHKPATVTAVAPLTDLTYKVMNGTATVSTGMMKDEGVVWGKQVYSLDFSQVTQTGSGFTIVSNGASSYPFPVQTNLWNSYKDEMTAFYRLQRSTDTSVAYPAGYSDIAPSVKIFHPDSFLDDAVAADGTHYDLTGGWFDAGDYGKYGGNQWVTGEIALAYLRNAGSAQVQYDHDGNGIPDLLDEARFGSEYLLKFADQMGGAIYNIKNYTSFQHPEKATDNIVGTADDPTLRELCVGGSGKAAGALAATARAINHAIANGRIASGKIAEMQAFSAEIASAALPFYQFALNYEGPDPGSYTTTGGIPNTLLWAETELYLLTGDSAYKDAAAARIAELAPGDLRSTNYWDMRPMTLTEFYPVADAATQAHIHSILKKQMEYFITSLDDTPYGVLDEFSAFGVNEPLASYIGDALRYNQLFPDPAVMKAAMKGLYWIFGNNPWNKSWVSGIGTDYVRYLHTRLDEESRSTANRGVVLPGAMVAGPNMKDTKDRTSVSPWYQDRPFLEDDINQWRYNEFSISIQAGLLYSVMALSASQSGSVGGVSLPALPVTSPVIGDYVTGPVTVFAEPQAAMAAMDYRVDGGYEPMAISGSAYAAQYDTTALAPYTNKRVYVRGTAADGQSTYSAAHFTVAPPLPDPDHPLLYDDFNNQGTWGTAKLGWVNWYNQDGGTGAFLQTAEDGRTVGKFTQTTSSTKSQAKFEPWKDRVDLSGYRYLTVVMKNPGYPGLQMKITGSGGYISVPAEWTTFHFDLDQSATLDKKSVHLELWLKQTTGVPGELWVDEIYASNQLAGTAPVLTDTALNAQSGDTDTLFTFSATYRDADNQKPHRVQVVIDGVIRDMAELDTTDTTYADGKRYTYSGKLGNGIHSYYFRTTDHHGGSVHRSADRPGCESARGPG